MQRKYCLILALSQGADILILDEPTSGVDPFDRGEVVSLIQEFMLDESKTVLFSTHITEDLDKIADYIVMMDNGKVVIDEDKETLTENYRLVQTDVLTDEMTADAIGITKNMFGYTFITKNKNLSGENIKTKIPTMEELFVHLTGDKQHSDDIFNL
jgi:ABC-2 type transport system ATP-binding protein